MDKSFIEDIKISLWSLSIFMPFLAYSYKDFPLCFKAEKAGGFCLDLPRNFWIVFSTSFEEKSKNYELTGSAWRQAQEVAKAIPNMEKAAELSDKGELYTRLGNVYLDSDEHKKAIGAVNKGLSKGGVKRPDSARLVLGMAHFNLGDYNSAKKAFREAAKDERSEKYARQWIRYIASEEERQREMAKDIW